VAEKLALNTSKRRLVRNIANRNKSAIVTVFAMLLFLTMQLLRQRFDPNWFYFSNAAATALLFVPSAAAWFGGSFVHANQDARS
jgi:hypothetical protein